MLNVIEHGSGTDAAIGRVVEIHMDKAPANAMDTNFVNALRAVHSEVCEQGAAAIVISGRPGMFSGGLDVPALIELERAEMLEFWVAFMDLMQAIASSPVPVIAAVTGHSPAGGAVLALHCDYRVAAAGEFKIGLNEVQVGLPVPSTIGHVLASLVGPHKAQEMTMQGKLVSPAEALTLGMVDELHEPDAVIPAAVAFAQRLTQLPPIAMNKTRLQAKEELLKQLADANDAQVTTEYWFSAETQLAMKALVERLKG
ncbi:MAG: enoyl-CoA hydratase/isomerase family protein [Gammaproteobacteria bacterium]|nr:enoyl-CoA hydratase/isomerase family protein [Gammaproteobacteria bacterium]